MEKKKQNKKKNKKKWNKLRKEKGLERVVKTIRKGNVGYKKIYAIKKEKKRFNGKRLSNYTYRKRTN